MSEFNLQIERDQQPIFASLHKVSYTNYLITEDKFHFPKLSKNIAQDGIYNLLNPNNWLNYELHYRL